MRLLLSTVLVLTLFPLSSAAQAPGQVIDVWVRPNGNGVVYSYKSFVIYVAGQSDDRSQNRIDDALQRLGAQ